ncbi:MAG: hypothetical protein JWR26_4004 [Pedosphaera sp.]|nr:hypothetical protein [Pedosphaera sp.]
MSQAENGGWGWSQTIGIVLGLGLVVAAFAFLAWIKHLSRVAQKERPPQKAKLLRPAGYSLQKRIDEVTEKWNSAVIQTTVAGSMLGLLCSGLYPVAEALLLQRVPFNHPQSYLLLSLAILTVSAMAWLVASLAQAVQRQRELRNCVFGMRGEQAVAEALAARTVAAAGYTVFHDVPGDGARNIDHIVVGPGGIFVLETKARSRRKPLQDQPDHVVYYDGQRLAFPWCEDRDAVRQVQRNADRMKSFLAEFAPENLTVQPVVVLPGWFVEAESGYPVRAMNAAYLAKHIAQSKRLYSEEQLRPTVRRFDERCRDLEF